MESVNNSLLSRKTLMEPVAFTALALLAGSTRIISVFPGATNRGLLMAAGMSSAASLVYNQTVHKVEHEYLTTLLGKVVMIACSNICAAFIAKSLNERVSLSPMAAARFAALEVAIAAVCTYVNQESELERKYRLYSTTENKAWRELEIEERSDLAKEFYEAGFSAISGAEIDPEGRFDDTEAMMEKLTQYSKNELSWYREFAEFHSEEQCFLFSKQCHQVGLLPTFNQFRYEFFEYIQESSDRVDLVYSWFSENPLYVFSCHFDFDAFFGGKPPLPQFETLVEQLDLSQVDTLSYERLLAWYKAFSDQDPEIWSTLGEPVRSVFVERFVDYDWRPAYVFINSPGDLSWFKDWLDSLVAETLPSPCSNNMRYWCLELIHKLDPQPNLTIEKSKAIFDKYQVVIPIQLTPEVVQLVATPESEGWELMMQIIYEQFGGRGQHDYGFSTLSFAEQRTLKVAFGGSSGRLPGYTLRTEVVELAGGDEDFLDELKRQFHHYGYRDTDYGFSGLSFQDQRTLKDLFGDQARDLPGYTLRAEVVTQAQRDEALLQALKQQFGGYHQESDYGFSELSFESQQALKVLFDKDARLLPGYQLTHELIKAAAGNPELLATIIAQFGDRGWHEGQKDYGFSSLQPQDQVDLKALFGEKKNSLPPIQITHEIVNIAEGHQDLVAWLKEQYREYYGRRVNDFGYSHLTLDDQKKLKKLFGDEQTYLPGYLLTSELLTAAETDEELAESLKIQCQQIRGERDPFGYSNLTLDEQIRLKVLLGGHSQRWLPPFTLTVALVNKANESPGLVDCLINQFTDFHGDDWGFLNLPIESQVRLRALFQDRERLLPLLVTHALVERLEGDEDLIERLRYQFQRGRGNDFGFFNLSPEDQVVVRQLLDNDEDEWGYKDYYIPYQITRELIEEQERDFTLREHLLRQFQGHNPKHDFGFYALDLPTQNRLRVLLGEGYTIPYHFNRELLAAAQQDRALAQAIKDQLNSGWDRSEFRGFDALSPLDRLAFIDLYREDEDRPPRFPDFQLTPEIIALAERNPPLVEQLKQQCSHHYYWQDEDFGFSALSGEQQRKLRQLFGRDARILPEGR